MLYGIFIYVEVFWSGDAAAFVNFRREILLDEPVRVPQLDYAFFDCLAPAWAARSLVGAVDGEIDDSALETRGLCLFDHKLNRETLQYEDVREEVSCHIISVTA